MLLYTVVWCPPSAFCGITARGSVTLDPPAVLLHDYCRILMINFLNINLLSDPVVLVWTIDAVLQAFLRRLNHPTTSQPWKVCRTVKALVWEDKWERM